MKYICTLLVVEHMERSKQFYREVLGQEVVSDLGANVTLSCGLSLQTMDSWKQFTRLEQISLGHNASELYFETEDLDAFEERLRSMPISYVHPVHQQPWGQRAMRFYDPDGHIIEVGETMPSVVRRFLAQGLTLEEVAQRTDVPLEYLTNDPQEP